MRVLITGGGGNLGRVLAPALEDAGHEPVLMDNRPLDTPHELVRADIRNKTEVLQALRDVDLIVHAAALHGIHLEKYSTDDFWDLNVAGTRHVYEAALESGIGKVLLCSTMAAYGEVAREGGDRPVHAPRYNFPEFFEALRGGRSVALPVRGPLVVGRLA